MPKRPARTPRADAQNKTKSKLRQDVEALVRDHFMLINDSPDRIHEAVASNVQSTTVTAFSHKVVDPPVKDGIPDFLRDQLNEDKVDLDALTARVSVDLQLQPTRGRRGTYLHLGRLRVLVQTKIALPATTVSGVRRTNRNPGRKGALYGGKSAQWKGIPTRTSRHKQGLTGEKDLQIYQTMEDMNLEPITVNFWLAKDDDEDPMEVYTIVETLLTSRFGLYTDKVGALKKDLANLPSYGIFQCHQEFVPSNEQLTINSVAGELIDKASALANLRDYEYERRKVNTGPRPQDHEDRYQQRAAVPVADGDPCPVEGCGRPLMPEKRRFHRATNQWICQTCS
ncbi:hypothetical protein M436DRAFT_79404 [Aureobasidium namibiae CBS 147.97]|uniref:Uncharacterized protein n=1 Tax=Aureobasidium namibiae CBS 147.97 TaxID=1043004 RepID=A0A074X2C9_9PEZI